MGSCARPKSRRTPVPPPQTSSSQGGGGSWIEGGLSKNYVFLDTKGACLLCFEECTPTTSEDLRRKNLQTSVNFCRLSARYLNFSMEKVVTTSLKTVGRKCKSMKVEEEPRRDKVGVELCDKCIVLAESFCQLHFQVEFHQMILDRCVRSITEVIQNANKKPKTALFTISQDEEAMKSEKATCTRLTLGGFKSAHNLRNKLFQKSLEKVSCSFPVIRLRRICKSGDWISLLKGKKSGSIVKGPKLPDPEEMLASLMGCVISFWIVLSLSFINTEELIQKVKEKGLMCMQQKLIQQQNAIIQSAEIPVEVLNIVPRFQKWEIAKVGVPPKRKAVQETVKGKRSKISLEKESGNSEKQLKRGRGQGPRAKAQKLWKETLMKGSPEKVESPKVAPPKDVQPKEDAQTEVIKTPQKSSKCSGAAPVPLQSSANLELQPSHQPEHVPSTPTKYPSSVPPAYPNPESHLAPPPSAAQVHHQFTQPNGYPPSEFYGQPPQQVPLHYNTQTTSHPYPSSSSDSHLMNYPQPNQDYYYNPHPPPPHPPSSSASQYSYNYNFTSYNYGTEPSHSTWPTYNSTVPPEPVPQPSTPYSPYGNHYGSHDPNYTGAYQSPSGGDQSGYQNYSSGYNNYYTPNLPPPPPPSAPPPNPNFIAPASTDMNSKTGETPSPPLTHEEPQEQVQNGVEEDCNGVSPKSKKLDNMDIQPLSIFPEVHWRQQQDDKIPCTFSNCTEQFVRKDHLELHLKAHGSFQCAFCLMTFGKAHSLALHEKSKHSLSPPGGNNKCKCSRCDFISSSQNNFFIHFLGEHLNIPVYERPCEICKKPFIHGTRSYVRKNHFKNYHDTEGKSPANLFICKKCNAPFLKEFQLKDHHLYCEAGITKSSNFGKEKEEDREYEDYEDHSRATSTVSSIDTAITFDLAIATADRLII